MADIGNFIKEARDKGLEDETIRSALADQGWSNAAIDTGLAGLTAPPSTNSPAASVPVVNHAQRPSLSPLMAALHHILLWFFTGSSTITIAGVVSSLSGINVSVDVLAAMIAVTIVTFIPYSALFIVYLRKAKKVPGLVPGKVWSIITICIHSIGAMIAAITVVINFITNGDSSVILSAGLILALNLIVVTNYCFAAFSSISIARLSRVINYLYLPILFILFGILFVLSVLQIGPAKQDAQTREDLAASVRKAYDYTMSNKRLPTNASDVVVNQTISYSKKSNTTYEVCGDFKTSRKADSYPRDTSQSQSDGYAYAEMFYASQPGRNCFTFSSNVLELENATAQ